MSANTMPRALSLGDTIVPLVIASLGTVLVYGGFIVATDRVTDGSIDILLLGAVFSFAAGMVLVFPVFAAIPRSRSPRPWVAAVWGILVAWATALLLYGRRDLFRPEVLAGFGVNGAVCGLMYSVAARWRARVRGN